MNAAQTTPSAAPPGAIVRPGEPRHYLLYEPIRTTATARVGSTVIASSTRAFRVAEFFGRAAEPVVYFPPGDVRGELLTPVDDTTVCPLKGTASYYDLATEPQVERGAWSYRKTHDFDPQLARLESCVAFDRERVTIEISDDEE